MTSKQLAHATLALSTESQVLVEVDQDACQRVASLLRDRSIPIDREDIAALDLSSNQLGNFYFFAVAICHQTSPWNRPSLSGEVNGKRSQGWDYLTARLGASCFRDPDLLNPARWTKMRGADIAEIFYDSDTIYGIGDADGRAELIRDLGCMMQARDWSDLADIYAFCEGRIGGDLPNLLSELEKFKAYRDPVKKKAFFLLSIMRNLGFWRYKDEDHLGPPVDYHEVRGHLRLGTVIVLDLALREKLLLQKRVTNYEDVVIRKSVFDAILLISALLDLHNPSQLHYLFWNIFRSCCGRDWTHCEACPVSCSLPDRYQHLGIKNGRRRCPFAEICPSRRVDRRYVEHVLDTDYY